MSSAAHGLVAATSPSPVGMHLDIAGVDHQPLEVRVIEAGPRSHGPASAKTGDGHSSSPRSLVAGPARGPQCARSRTPRPKTGGYPGSVVPSGQHLPAKATASVPTPDPKGRDGDAPLSSSHSHTVPHNLPSHILTIYTTLANIYLGLIPGGLGHTVTIRIGLPRNLTPDGL